MGRPFELDTKDMERHAVELRLFMDKARRRFDKAQLADQFEKIVKNTLAQTEAQVTEHNSVRIDSVNNDSAQRLASFIDALVDKCSLPEQHEALQNALRASLHQARRKSVLNGSLAEGFMEQICYFCAGSPQQNNTQHQHQQHHHQQSGFSVHNLLAAIGHQLTPPSSIEGPSPVGDPLANGGAAPTPQPDHAFPNGSSGRPSPDDGQPVELNPHSEPQAEAQQQQREDRSQDKDERADTIVGSQDSNASHALEIDLDAGGGGEAEGEADEELGNANDNSERLNDSDGTQRGVIPPSPEEAADDPSSDGAHEDSMHEWFENLNQTALPVQQASTPVSSNSKKLSDFKKVTAKKSVMILDHRSRNSDIEYSIVKKDHKDLNTRKLNMKSRALESAEAADQSLNSLASSVREGHMRLTLSQQIQSTSSHVDNNDNDGDGDGDEDDDRNSTNFLQTSATQPVRSSLVVKSKPKRGRPKGQNSKRLCR